MDAADTVEGLDSMLAMDLYILLELSQDLLEELLEEDSAILVSSLHLHSTALLSNTEC